MTGSRYARSLRRPPRCTFLLVKKSPVDLTWQIRRTHLSRSTDYRSNCHHRTPWFATCRATGSPTEPVMIRVV